MEFPSPLSNLSLFLFANDAEITNIWCVPSVSAAVRWACSLILVNDDGGRMYVRVKISVGSTACSLSAC